MKTRVLIDQRHDRMTGLAIVPGGATFNHRLRCEHPALVEIHDDPPGLQETEAKLAPRQAVRSEWREARKIRKMQALVLDDRRPDLEDPDLRLISVSAFPVAPLAVPIFRSSSFLSLAAVSSTMIVSAPESTTMQTLVPSTSASATSRRSSPAFLTGTPTVPFETDSSRLDTWTRPACPAAECEKSDWTRSATAIRGDFIDGGTNGWPHLEGRPDDFNLHSPPSGLRKRTDIQDCH